jgi:hypothetical protein
MKARKTLAPPHTWRLAYRDTMVKATAGGVIRARGARGTKPIDAIVLPTTIG